MRYLSHMNIFLLPIAMIFPLVILYFTIKFAVKKAIKELKNEDVL